MFRGAAAKLCGNASFFAGSEAFTKQRSVVAFLQLTKAKQTPAFIGNFCDIAIQNNKESYYYYNKSTTNVRMVSRRAESEARAVATRGKMARRGSKRRRGGNNNVLRFVL